MIELQIGYNRKHTIYSWDTCMSATSTRNSTPVVSPTKVTQRINLRLRFVQVVTVALAAITAAAFVFYLLSATEWHDQTFLGVTTSHTMVVNGAVSTTGTPWAGHEAGLQQHDQVLAINGEVLAEDHTDYATMQSTYDRIIENLAPGESITVEVARLPEYLDNDANNCVIGTDGIATCELTYTLRPLLNLDFLAFFVVPFITGIITFIIGVTVLVMRSEQIEGLLIACAAFFASIYVAGLFDIGDTNLLAPLWLMSAVWLGGTLVTIGFTFPLKLYAIQSQPILRYLPLFISTIAGVVILQRHLNPATPWDYNFASQLATYVAIIGLLGLGTLIIVAQRPRATTPSTRDQSNTILIGVGLMLLLTVIWLFNRLLEGTGQSILPLSFETLIMTIIFPIAGLAYGVLQYRRIDTDQIISQGLTYGIMMAVLIAGYFLLVLGSSLFTQDTLGLENAGNPFLIAITIFIMSVLFIPIRTRLQSQIDKIYFRSRQNYQRSVEEFAQQLPTLTTFDEIVTAFRSVLNNTIAPQAIFVYLKEQSDEYVAFGKETDVRFSHDSGIVKVLENQEQAVVLQPGVPWRQELWTDRARLTILKAVVVAGLAGTDELNGFVVLAPSRSGAEVYSFEQIRFINNLVSQLSIAIERAQIITSLEQRVHELNVLSQVGQAVNFTIEFNDLLELISAQTSRLIDAPYFYIALFDETSDQLYFAFFLEQDERYVEKENLRWNLGKDTFSEIITTSKPIRVENYQKELEKRGFSTVFENRKLNAWMGVPLEAGRQMLGVIAVGKTTPGEAYNDEDFRIFSNIAALAATSIEKARLFTETRVRERQLTVLNDISRQLVATELDVEKLLQIIMSSAVEILNSEAGSLLLTTDDGTNDLEFKVVIGGAADTLTGTRWRAGEGIVGQVARTGEPVILNDTSQDPRHAQQASPEFHTTSLLAVPMIAKDRVVGVLEILNKRDGTIFTDTDAELLTTFAGQAAVAIENARLFQMTDIQLSQRVRELEILERIDNELNRTLDLREVAAITVRSAVVNCHAEAGALGIVTGVPPYLEIVAIQGYSENEHPAGGEGMAWPIDRGIVKRVMRSRQADLAADTTIDPDYEPSLSNSISQITVPMLSGDEINAILILETNVEPAFNLSDWAFAQRLAEHASIAIANAQLYDMLTNANKTKSEFMGFAAHELKNPLTPVITSSDLLRKGMAGEMNDQQLHFLDMIYDNARRMQTIISDLRDSARLDANEFGVELEPIDIRHVVINTLQPFVHTLEEKNQELINNVPENLPLIVGDQTRLIQVLTNLVSNAHKYSPEETTITINAEVIDNYVDHKGKRRGPMMKISIIDQGIGISKDEQEKLFKERYFRASNVGDIKGTGLGMTLTAGIIARHQGEIWVESEIDQGSTFSFVIPLAKSEEQWKSQPETEAASD